MRVLIVDDEPDIVTLLTHFLSASGREVTRASNGQEALATFERERPDLVLLDVRMPALDGWETLARLREMSDVPVIMLTAKGETMDKTRGLLTGADDYVTKPFDFGELEARISAVMRRYQVSERSGVIRVGDVAIDDANKDVHVQGQPVQLSPLEYELLKLLASSPGKVFSHDEIIQEVWRDKPHVSSADVAKYVNLVRKKVEADPSHPELVLNVRGFGYKLDVN